MDKIYLLTEVTVAIYEAKYLADRLEVEGDRPSEVFMVITKTDLEKLETLSYEYKGTYLTFTSNIALEIVYSPSATVFTFSPKQLVLDPFNSYYEKLLKTGKKSSIEIQLITVELVTT